MKKIIGIAILLLAACNNNVPFPPLTSGNDTDGGVMGDTTNDAVVLNNPTQTIPSQSNGYVCYCRAEIPNNCISGCGIPLTGTHGDGNYCAVETKAINVCLPPELNINSIEHTSTSHTPTNQEIEADCTGRIQNAVGEALRFAFGNCNNNPPNLGACDIAYGCQAVQVDGTITVFQNDRCNMTCPTILLAHDGSTLGANYTSATVIQASDEIDCSFEHNYTTSRICMWQ